MLLWYVIAICFAACVLAYHLWQGITWMEAIVLLVAARMTLGLVWRPDEIFTVEVR